MKIIISIFLALSFLIQNLNKTLIVLNYQANKDYIAKNLCVNRTKPKSCCEGKCELNKQLNKADKESDNSDSTNKNKIEKDEYCNHYFKLNFFENNQVELFAVYQSQISKGSYLKLLRPPGKNYQIV